MTFMIFLSAPYVHTGHCHAKEGMVSVSVLMCSILTSQVRSKLTCQYWRNRIRLFTRFLSPAHVHLHIQRIPFLFISINMSGSVPKHASNAGHYCLWYPVCVSNIGLPLRPFLPLYHIDNKLNSFVVNATVRYYYAT